MIKINMDNYNILIESNVFASLRDFLDEINKRVFIVTDTNVDNLYGKELANILDGFEIIKYVIPSGEISKNFKTYEAIMHHFLSKGIKRFDTLIAFGGGVVGDLAGFVAATLFRGIDYIQIPTTLLSQVDSSIGGKTGIDTPYGKNLIGAFYEPKVVLIDPNFLKSLDDIEYANGLSEMIKAGLIMDKDLFDQLEKSQTVNDKLIAQAIEVKRKVVLLDPFDYKERMLLNFGHTFGHAIEFKHQYETYKHGQAIAYGMLMSIKIGERLNLTNTNIYDRVYNLFLKLKLIELPLLDPKDYLDYLKFDKKHLSNGLNFVLIDEIGSAFTKTLELKDLI